MNYPECRRQGLPITTAWMESLVKEIHWRVKGTEMFWNNPQSAEAIVQIRAAALCDDGLPKRHLQNRPGSPFTRRPKSANSKSRITQRLTSTPVFLTAFNWLLSWTPP